MSVVEFFSLLLFGVVLLGILTFITIEVIYRIIIRKDK